MDALFLGFVIMLGVAGVVFTGVFVYRLMQVKEIGPATRKFNIGLLAIAGLAVVVGVGLAMFGRDRLADWGTVLAAGSAAFAMVMLAAEGFGVGFKQMDEDGVGFLRFFQLGSSILLCLAFAPAFYAFITYATKLR